MFRIQVPQGPRGLILGHGAPGDRIFERWGPRGAQGSTGEKIGFSLKIFVCLKNAFNKKNEERSKYRSEFIRTEWSDDPHEKARHAASSARRTDEIQMFLVQSTLLVY